MSATKEQLVQQVRRLAIERVAITDEVDTHQYWSELDSNLDFLTFLESKAFKYVADEGTTHFTPGQDLSKYPNYFSSNELSAFAPFYHDSVIMYGLAACKAFSEGKDVMSDYSYVLAAMQANVFEGFSGNVRIGETLSRDPSSVSFSIENIVVQPDGSVLVSRSATFDSTGGFSSSCFGCSAFIYSDGGGSRPLQRVDVDVDKKKTQPVMSKGGIAALVVSLCAVVVASFAAFFLQRKQSNEKIGVLKTQISEKENVITHLKEELTILKHYDEKEEDLINENLTSFREEFRALKKSSADPLSQFLISASVINPTRQIGKGSFGEVYVAEYMGKEVAVKSLSSVDEVNLTRFRNEILLMTELKHENIITMLGAVWEKSLMALVLEFCQRGSMGDFLKKEGMNHSWANPLLTFALDIASGLQYVHGIQIRDLNSQRNITHIMHRDVKPDNCLITDTYSIKICDFGEARAEQTDQTMTMVGSPFYVAPVSRSLMLFLVRRDAA